MITYNIKISDNLPVYSDMVFTSGDVRAYKFNFDFIGIPASNCTLTLKAKRADDVIVTESGSVSGGIVLPNSMYSVPGEVQFEVALYSGAGCVTTKVIYANVREGFGEDNIAGDDRYPVLTTLINQVNSIKQITVDSEISPTSENPVQNKAIYNEFNQVLQYATYYHDELNRNKVDKVTGKGLSTNDYTNGEKAKLAKLPDKFTVDSEISSTSENPVQNKAIWKELDYFSILWANKADQTDVYTKAEIDEMYGDIDTALDSIISVQNSLTGGDSV